MAIRFVCKKCGRELGETKGKKGYEIWGLFGYCCFEKGTYEEEPEEKVRCEK